MQTITASMTCQQREKYVVTVNACNFLIAKPLKSNGKIYDAQMKIGMTTQTLDVAHFAIVEL